MYRVTIFPARLVSRERSVIHKISIIFFPIGEGSEPDDGQEEGEDGLEQKEPADGEALAKLAGVAMERVRTDREPDQEEKGWGEDQERATGEEGEEDRAEREEAEKQVGRVVELVEASLSAFVVPLGGGEGRFSFEPPLEAVVAGHRSEAFGREGDTGIRAVRDLVDEEIVVAPVQEEAAREPFVAEEFFLAVGEVAAVARVGMMA